MMQIPFAFIASSGIVTGADGDLVITSGQTVDLAEGSVKQYSSINIASGGTLRITGTTGAWTEIGCSGDCVINGQIIARAGYDGQVTHSGGTFTKTSAFGLGSLSYTITQANGGAGGVGDFSISGGAQSLGRGGGGGGGNGGVGGTNGGAGGVGYSGAAGGAGGGLGNGSTGGNASVGGASGVGGAGASGGGGGGRFDFKSATSVYGGGGGGGYKGHHGKGLVLYVEGILSGTGSVAASGRAGFSGGNSGTGQGTGGAFVSSGGGGGGAGGSGGSVVIRYRNSGTLPALTVIGGTGGARGTSGSSTYFGVNGSAGSNGTSSISQI